VSQPAYKAPKGKPNWIGWVLVVAAIVVAIVFLL